MGNERKSIVYFDELISEEEACRRFSLIVGPRELRKTRQAGAISYFSGKKGAVFYHPDALAAYFQSKEIPRREYPSEPSQQTDIEADSILENHLREKYSKMPPPRGKWVSKVRNSALRAEFMLRFMSRGLAVLFKKPLEITGITLQHGRDIKRPNGSAIF